MISLSSESLLQQIYPAESISSCLTSPVNSLEQQILIQNIDIYGIQRAMSNTGNSFYINNINTITDSLQYQQEVNDVFGYQSSSSVQYGLLGNYLYSMGVWAHPYGPEVESINTQLISANESAMARIGELISNVSGGTPSPNTFIQNLFGVNYSVQNCSIAPYNCYKTVASNQSTTLMQLFQSYLNNAQAAINSESPNTNIVPIFQQYNDTISSYYVQGVAIIQTLYYVEFLNNQLNYNNGVNLQYSGSTSAQNQIGSLSGVPGTNFQYSFKLDPSNIYKNQLLNAQQYNQAQTQLTYFYGALVNQLYNNTLSFILSDTPVGNQMIPLPYESTLVYNGVTYNFNTNGMYNSLYHTGFYPIETLYNNISLYNYNESAMLYQYDGIRNIGECQQSIDTYNRSQTSLNNLTMINNMEQSSCPSIFWNTLANNSYSNSILTTNVAQPYYAISSATPPVLTGLTYNNVGFCYPNSSYMFYNYMTFTVTNGTTYLYCAYFPAPSFNVNTVVTSQTATTYIGGVTYNSTINFPNSIYMNTLNGTSGNGGSNWGDIVFSGQRYNLNTMTTPALCNTDSTSCQSVYAGFNLMLPDGTWVYLQSNLSVYKPSDNKTHWTTAVNLSYNANANFVDNGYEVSINTNDPAGLTFTTAVGNTFTLTTQSSNQQISYLLN